MRRPRRKDVSARFHVRGDSFYFAPAVVDGETVSGVVYPEKRGIHPLVGPAAVPAFGNDETTKPLAGTLGVR
ncbi:hypothetical protein HJB89_17040 [Rhizobium sp. NZLR8]|uniref:hypothetical protein n=1 Tax=Rhizobium sp. NZLR8 TaxID=2731104 RepID=UPI001C82BC55|nr:hypothetical protein [Rhizobium sp. NZLR8]MBX5158824.1 hypothetical protein [Rhizobium sp. NZLR8]